MYLHVYLMSMETHYQQGSEEEFAARLYGLIEWMHEQISRPDFEWPEDFDPDEYRRRADQLLQE